MNQREFVERALSHILRLADTHSDILILQCRVDKITGKKLPGRIQIREREGERTVIYEG